MAKNLKELVALLPDAVVRGELNHDIQSLVYDSRKCSPGALFICLTGHTVDGHEYVAQARQLGTVAVLVEKDVEVDHGLTVIKVISTRAAMQILAPFFFDYPSRKLRMIGVTGTNGKTTTTNLIRNILLRAGFKVGLIGTIHNIIGERIIQGKNTTPDVVDLQETLAEMVASGMDYLVMEVSSHALALSRVAGCEFDVGVYTNITRDHLDFHQTFENYIDAKAELFRLLGTAGAYKTGKTAVINLDDPAANVMINNSHCRVITYSVTQPADLSAKDIDVRATGASFTLSGSFGTVLFNLKFTGIFNVYNAVAACGAALAEGVDIGLIKEALEACGCVAGRFELVDEGQDFAIIVDYAHTPDGLENILKTASQFAKRRIILVFGCGGDRDRTKRPIMGKLAVEYADVVIATSDNPRTEDPKAILREVEAGIKEGGGGVKKYEVIIDRREAIERALRLAEAQDIVIIAGKGHETYQILKDRTIPFDDREIAREIVREMR